MFISQRDNQLKTTNVGVSRISSSSCSSSSKQISSSSPIPFQPYLLPIAPFQTQNTPPYSSSMSNSNQISTPRKRKQPANDSNSFVTPSIPAKRSTPLTMFFPKVTPSDSSVVILSNNSKMTQTDSTLFMSTSSHQLDIEQQHLTIEIEELNRAKSDIQRQVDSTLDTIKRCLTVTRSLLIEKSQLEKKQARQKAMENRLRLGQFVTQRQGTSFVEQWVDGYDFLDKQREQEQLAKAKEILDRERKNLTKKKTLAQQQQQMTINLEETSNQNSNFNSQDFNQFIQFTTNNNNNNNNKTKRTTKTSMIKPLTRYRIK